jgi:hypothetical protein
MAKRGRPKKIREEVISNGSQKEEEVQQTEGDVLTVPLETLLVEDQPLKPEPRRFEEKPAAPEAVRIAESRKSLNETLGPDQKFFESPEGEIIVGPADKNEVWSRHMNGGRGGWVNPRR